MGYFLHRLVDERSDYEGDEIRSGNHGFLRSFVFEAPTFDPGARSLTFSVEPERIPKAAYPRAVALRLVYALTSHGVTVSFHFENREDRTAHVSFGLHPGFAVSSLEKAVLELPAGEYLRLFAPGNFLDGSVESVPVEAGPMPFDKGKLPDSFIFSLQEVPERTFTLRDEVAGREVALDFSEVPYLTLWSDGGPFLCVEPCWGLPDSRPQKPFEDKDGIQVIGAGGSLSSKFSIACRLL
jgi:galactose mutarotase-like enzyme